MVCLTKEMSSFIGFTSSGNGFPIEFTTITELISLGAKNKLVDSED